MVLRLADFRSPNRTASSASYAPITRTIGAFTLSSKDLGPEDGVEMLYAPTRRPL